MKHSVLASAIMLVAASVFGAAPDYTASLEFVANPNKVGFTKDMNRPAHALQFFHGKLYNGGGEVEKNGGPVPMYATDPISKTFALEYTAATEEIGSIHLSSWGDMLAPCEDPKGGSHIVYTRTPSGEWAGHSGPRYFVYYGGNAVEYYTHSWDLIEFDDRLFVAGYGIYASTDHCATFTDASTSFASKNFCPSLQFPTGSKKTGSYGILLRQQHFVQVGDELFSVYNGILSPNARRTDYSNINQSYGSWYNSSTKQFEFISINLEDVFPNVSGNDFAMSCGLTTQDQSGNKPTDPYFHTLARIWHPTPFKGRCLYVGSVDNESYYDGDTGSGGVYRNTSYSLSFGGFSAEKATGSGDFTHRFKAKKLDFGTETYPLDFCVVGDVCYALTAHFNATTQLVEHKIWKTTDGETFDEVVKFDFHQNFISLARYDGSFYVGAGWKSVRHDYNYNSAADEAGAIYRIPDPEMASRVIVTAPATKVGEDQQVAVSVKLSAAPSENVTLTVGANTANTVSLDKTSLTFTPSNYNTPQTVNVSVSQITDVTPIAIFCGKGGGSSVLGEYENSVVASGTAAVPVKMPESYSSKWWYDATTKTITDYIWKFNATLSETSITVGVPVDDECPTEVTPLDFSKPVVDLADGTTAYTITAISTEFQKNGVAARASAQYVGELTLPGEGLTTISQDAFQSCTNLTGSLVFPTTLTTLGISAFQNSGVQAVDFKPATASISGNYGRGAFKDCTSLERVRFRSGGSFTITTGYTFNGCTALKDVDFSGVTSASVSKGSYGIFAGCTALTNITLGSTLALSGGTDIPGYALFSSTQKALKSIHFTGAPPADFESWITADGGYLSLIGATQKVSTYVPEANVNNWKKYSASDSIAGSGTTFASTYLKSGVDPANRPLLIAGAAPAEPEDDPVVVHTHVWGNWVTNVFPTATADGQRYRECTASGCSNPPVRQTETIPALGGGDDPDPQEGSDLTASLVNHGIPLSSKYTTQYYARNPWDLKAFEGRLYIGSGNSANTGPNTNAGPVPIKSYNPATSNCVEELVIQQEQIDVFRILEDGGLYIPGHDPKGGNGSVYLRSPGSSGANAWKQFNNLTGCEHCYDVTMFDGKFIASGSNLWVSPNTNAANVAAFTAYNITGRRYSMLRFPNTLYAVGTAMVGGTVGTLTYAESFGIDRLPKGGAFAPVENAGSTTWRYADKQYVFPGIDDMVVKKEYIVQRPVSFGSRVIYIGGLSHNDHQLLPLAAFSAVDGEVCFTATRISLPEGAVPWDTLVAGDKVYLLWTTKSGDKLVNHVSESSDGLAFTEIFRFTADSFARSFEYLKRRFYFGLGAENVDIFNPYSAANNSLLSAASGTILSCPYDLNLPEDDIEYPQEDEPVTPPDPNATAKAVWDANTKTFTFYYDTNTYEGAGITQYALTTGKAYNTTEAWSSTNVTWRADVQKVVFDESFRSCKPVNLNYWFSGFTGLTTIEHLDYLDTTGATYASGMFKNCSSLTSLDLSNFNSANLSFRECFNGCSNIEVLDLTSFTRIRDTRSMFKGMTNLKTIIVTDQLVIDTTANTDNNEFSGCSALVGGAGTAYATVKNATREYARIDNPPDAPGYFTLKGSEPVDQWTLSEDELSITDGVWTFEVSDYWSKKIIGKCIGYPETVTPLDFSKPFVDKNGNILTLYNFKDCFNGENGCEYVGAVTLPTACSKLDTNVFKGCVNMSVPDGFPENLTSIGMYAFMDSGISGDLELPYVTELQRAVFMRTAITSVKFGAGLTSFVDAYESGVFQGCTSLTNVTFNPASSLTLSGGEGYTFKGCTALKTVDLSGVTVLTCNNSAEKSLFKDCQAIEKVTMSNLTSITKMVFSGSKVSEYHFYGAAPTLTDGLLDLGASGAVTYIHLTDDSQLDGWKALAQDGVLNATDSAWKTDITGAGYPLLLAGGNPEESDATAKAVYDDVAKTLTFYYDENTYSGEGVTQYAMNTGNNVPVWTNCAATVTKVVITDAFRYYQPTTVYRWFYSMRNLASIDGLTNLDTTGLTSLRRMFQGCSSLTTLDLSSFDTSKVTNFGEMFDSCKALKTIFVSDSWTVGATNSTDTFDGCSALVGGAGTKYSSEHVNADYARIDNPPNAPGYLTLSGSEPYNPPVVEHTHVWGNWVTNVYPTATTAGERYRECTAEGCTNPVARETETIPATGGGDDPEDPPVGTVTITLTAPADGAMYDTHLQALKKYLANSDARSEFPDDDLIAARDTDGNHYVHNAWFTNLLVEASVEQATYKPFTWEKTGDITDIVVEYSEDADFTEGNVISEKYCRDNETSTRPLNLKLATKYWWRVKAKDANGGDVVSDVRTFTTEGVAPRIIGTLGFNMRDLGGGTNAEGLVVRQGVILRGKCPMARVNAEAGWNDQKMTEQSYREFYLDKHHIRTELDFRSADEALEHRTKYDEIDLATIGIDHLNYSIIPYHLGHPDTDDGIVRSVKMLAEGTHYPVYFNCAVGSDRTGTFGVIIDGIVGRDDQWFYDNYELPSFSEGLPRLRYCRKGSEMFRFLQDHNLGEHFRDRVVQYLLSKGVTREEIKAVRAAMLELPAEGDPRELKIASAVYDESTQKLTFYYDDIDHSGAGKTVYMTTDGSRSWGSGLATNAVEVVFDESFAAFHPLTCTQWFQNFKSLTTISGIANLKTDQATNLGNMFRDCPNLASIDVTGFDTSKVTSMASMFYSCKALTSLDLSSFVTTNLTTMGMMFYDCSKLVKVTVDTGFTTVNVTTDGGANVFRKASKLVGANGTKCDGTNNIGAEYARVDNPPDAPGYFTLKGAEPVDPPVVEHTHVWGNWVTNKVATATESGERYRECTAEGCTNPVARETETIPALGGGDDPGPQEDDPVISYPDDPEDPDADLPEDAELAARAVRIGDTIRFYYDKKSHTRDGSTVSVIPVAGTRTWLAPDGDDLQITNVIFYSSFKSFKPKSMSGWFHYYRALKNVVGLHNIDTSEVTRMDNLFRCKSGNNPNIIELDLSAWDTRSCMNMSYMFARLSGLKTVYVGDNFVVTRVTSSSNMFDRCSAIVGGAGTKYLDSTEGKDKTRAKVDGGTEDPGYFTYKATSSGPVIVKPELGSATIVTGDGKTFRISVSNPVVGAAYTLFTATALDGEFTAEADSTVYASGDLLLDFAIEDGVPQKFAKIVISTTPYKQGDPLPEE